MTVAQSKAVKGSVKLKKGEKLELAVILRTTPRSEARKRSEDANLTGKQKKRQSRKEEREKARAAKRAAEEKKRAEWERSVRVEKPKTSSRYASYNAASAASSEKTEAKSGAKSESKSVPEPGDGE